MSTEFNTLRDRVITALIKHAPTVDTTYAYHIASLATMDWIDFRDGMGNRMKTSAEDLACRYYDAFVDVFMGA